MILDNTTVYVILIFFVLHMVSPDCLHCLPIVHAQQLNIQCYTAAVIVIIKLHIECYLWFYIMHLTMSLHNIMHVQ